jgi:hypothetical protein
LGLFQPFPERVRETLPDLIEIYHVDGTFGILLKRTTAALLTAIQAAFAAAVEDGVMLIIPVDSADQLLARLQNAGVSIQRDKSLPWARHIVVVDPFGNRLQLNEEYPRSEE